MKKIFILYIFLSLIFLTGCPDSKTPSSESDNKKETMRIDMKASKEFMDNYMRYVMKMNTEAMKSFYTSRLSGEIKDVSDKAGPHPIGYKLEEGHGKEETAEITAHIYNGLSSKPYYSDDTYKYSLVMQDGKILIDKIDKQKTVEIFEKDKGIYMKEGNKTQGQHIVSLADFPTYASPKASPEKKLSVPKDTLGPCAISPEDKKIIITSMGKDSFVAIAEISQEGEETQAFNQPGGGGGQQKQQDGQVGGGEGQGGEEGKKQEKKMPNTTLTPVDLYISEKINAISLSPDGKIFAVERMLPTGITRINIYKTEGSESIDMDKVNNEFKEDRFYFSHPYFTSPTQLYFTITPAASATDEENMLKGDYIYDTKTKDINKIK